MKHYIKHGVLRHGNCPKFDTLDEMFLFINEVVPNNWLFKSDTYFWLTKDRKGLTTKLSIDTSVHRFSISKTLKNILYENFHGGTFTIDDVLCLRAIERDNKLKKI